MYKPCINEKYKKKKTCINININVVCINFEILKIIYVLWG